MASQKSQKTNPSDPSDRGTEPAHFRSVEACKNYVDSMLRQHGWLCKKVIEAETPEAKAKALRKLGAWYAKHPRLARIARDALVDILRGQGRSDSEILAMARSKENGDESNGDTDVHRLPE